MPGAEKNIADFGVGGQQSPDIVFFLEDHFHAMIGAEVQHLVGPLQHIRIKRRIQRFEVLGDINEPEHRRRRFLAAPDGFPADPDLPAVGREVSEWDAYFLEQGGARDNLLGGHLLAALMAKQVAGFIHHEILQRRRFQRVERLAVFAQGFLRHSGEIAGRHEDLDFFGIARGQSRLPFQCRIDILQMRFQIGNSIIGELVGAAKIQPVIRGVAEARG
ncbi:MAG: hypothetical protein BWZ10_01511 [candidate division BRC1 bacterium ADurb.BinA364]|nr:MAG: hypothetical protein BWZ10_01511 [candidate division BRC1 bacterium ADurb.BinA364]